MSTERIDDGGPAFPIQPNGIHGGWEGMTLRDYFAAKAMQAIVGSMPRVRDRSTSELYAIALGSYDYADAMLRAREVKP